MSEEGIIKCIIFRNYIFFVKRTEANTFKNNLLDAEILDLGRCKNEAQLDFVGKKRFSRIQKVKV